MAPHMEPLLFLIFLVLELRDLLVLVPLALEALVAPDHVPDILDQVFGGLFEVLYKFLVLASNSDSSL